MPYALFMVSTVAEVLELPMIQAGAPQVLSGAGLDRPVRWVHSIDVADLTNLLQGGELVLTTGGGLLAEPRRYIESVAEAGAVGVVVELLDAGVHVPAAAVQAATERGLALVVLRQEIRFVEVTEQVHRSIVAAQYEEVAFARQVHEEFTHLTIQRASPADIVTTAATLLGVAVVLEDLAHQVLAAAPGGASSQGQTAEVAVVLQNWERRSRWYGDETHDGGTDGESWTVQPVGRGEEAWGRLIAVHAGRGREGRPGRDDRQGREGRAQRTMMVLERAAQALTMHRMAERDQTSMVHQAQAGLIGDVLQERVRTESEALARAQALGMRAGEVYVPGVARVAGWDDAADPLSAQRRESRLLGTVARTVRAQGHTGLFASRPDGAIAMVLQVAPGRRGLDESVDHLGYALRRDVTHSLGAQGLVLGIGSVKPGLVEVIDELLGAAHIAEVASRLVVTDQVCFRVSDIRLRGLVTLLRDDPRLVRFAEAELRELILDDLDTGMNGIGVLRAYLEESGNKTALAARLHLSRPALYTRLARIEKVLGVDLDDGESKASLHVALLIWEARAAAAPETV